MTHKFVSNQDFEQHQRIETTIKCPHCGDEISDYDVTFTTIFTCPECGGEIAIKEDYPGYIAELEKSVSKAASYMGCTDGHLIIKCVKCMGGYGSKKCKSFRKTHGFRITKNIQESNIQTQFFKPEKYEGTFFRSDDNGSSQFCNCGKQICAICGCCTCGTAPTVCVHSQYLITEDF